ncbi:hypothetical protein BDR26DRAFT_903766 [Obelidium mucronatum]|nr:hypothetical protein BDR26DRAFT_903766 [Obelidium mucronatum]
MVAWKPLWFAERMSNGDLRAPVVVAQGGSAGGTAAGGAEVGRVSGPEGRNTRLASSSDASSSDGGDAGNRNRVWKPRSGGLLGGRDAIPTIGKEQSRLRRLRRPNSPLRRSSAVAHGPITSQRCSDVGAWLRAGRDRVETGGLVQPPWQLTLPPQHNTTTPVHVHTVPLHLCTWSCETENDENKRTTETERTTDQHTEHAHTAPPHQDTCKMENVQTYENKRHIIEKNTKRQNGRDILRKKETNGERDKERHKDMIKRKINSNKKERDNTEIKTVYLLRGGRDQLRQAQLENSKAQLRIRTSQPSKLNKKTIRKTTKNRDNPEMDETFNSNNLYNTNGSGNQRVTCRITASDIKILAQAACINLPPDASLSSQVSAILAQQGIHWKIHSYDKLLNGSRCSTTFAIEGVERDIWPKLSASGGIKYCLLVTGIDNSNGLPAETVAEEVKKAYSNLGANVMSAVGNTKMPKTHTNHPSRPNKNPSRHHHSKPYTTVSLFFATIMDQKKCLDEYNQIKYGRNTAQAVRANEQRTVRTAREQLRTMEIRNAGSLEVEDLEAIRDQLTGVYSFRFFTPRDQPRAIEIIMRSDLDAVAKDKTKVSKYQIENLKTNLTTTTTQTKQKLSLGKEGEKSFYSARNKFYLVEGKPVERGYCSTCNEDHLTVACPETEREVNAAFNKIADATYRKTINTREYKVIKENMEVYAARQGGLSSAEVEGLQTLQITIKNVKRKQETYNHAATEHSNNNNNNNINNHTTAAPTGPAIVKRARPTNGNSLQQSNTHNNNTGRTNATNAPANNTNNASNGTYTRDLGEYIKKSEVAAMVEKAVLKALGMKNEDDVPGAAECSKGWRGWSEYVDNDIYKHDERLNELEAAVDLLKQETHGYSVKVHGDRENEGFMDRLKAVEDAIYYDNEEMEENEHENSNTGNEHESEDVVMMDSDDEAEGNAPIADEDRNNNRNQDDATTDEEETDGKEEEEEDKRSPMGSREDSGGRLTPVPKAKGMPAASGKQKGKENALKRAEKAE